MISFSFVNHERQVSSFLRFSHSINAATLKGTVGGLILWLNLGALGMVRESDTDIVQALVMSQAFTVLPPKVIDAKRPDEESKHKQK